MAYEIWHGETANMLGSYPTKAAALAVVRAALRAHGEPYVEELALLESAPDDIRMIAEGHDLVRAVAPPPPPKWKNSPSPSTFARKTAETTAGADYSRKPKSMTRRRRPQQ